MLAIDKNKDILIANVGGNYYANNNMCTNKGAKLREGELLSLAWCKMGS